MRENDVRSLFRGEPEEDEQRFGSAGNDLDALFTYSVHLGDSRAQPVRAGSTPLRQRMIQVAFALVIAG